MQKNTEFISKIGVALLDINKFTENENNSQQFAEQIKSSVLEESSLELLIKGNENLSSEISKLRQQVNSQNDAINKILTSQILILKKCLLY